MSYARGAPSAGFAFAQPAKALHDECVAEASDA
jgi:hypothetical protein